jgi:hypothetical protein
MDSEQISVLLLVLLIWIAVIATCIFVSYRDKRAPADDIGVLWLVVLGMYCTFSPISWLLQDGSYGFLTLYRLYALQPTTDEMKTLLEIGLAFSVAFAGPYLLFRWHVPRGDASIYTRICTTKMTAAVGIIIVFQAIMLFLRFGGFIRMPDSYWDSYLVLQELPLALRQTIKIGGGFASVAMLVCLVGILQRWPRHRLPFFVYIAMVLFSFDPKGARTGIVIGLMSVGIAWHVLIRPIALYIWLASGSFGLVAFTALGIIRSLEADSFDEIREASTEGYGIGEFDAIWANGVELLQSLELGRLSVPPAAQFGEFWAFVPSQLLPFEKMTLSDWFVETFYPQYQAEGGGWAFGAISQAVIGSGIIEAIIRGSLLGIVAAYIMKWYRSPVASWWRFPLYLYLLVFVYQSVRDTTFMQIGYVLQIALPTLILIGLIDKLLTVNLRLERHAETACQTPSLYDKYR